MPATKANRTTTTTVDGRTAGEPVALQVDVPGASPARLVAGRSRLAHIVLDRSAGCGLRHPGGSR